MTFVVTSRLSRIPILLAVAAAMAGFGPAAAGAQDAGARTTSGPVVRIVGNGGQVEVAGADVLITGTANHVSAAGARVEINADVTGAIRAAGAQVTVFGSTGGPVRVAGGYVEVGGRFGADVYLGGAVVRFDGSTKGELKAGAATVEIEAGADIAGQLTAGAADLTVAGHIHGPAWLSGAAVAFNGAADGNVTAESDTVTIGPNATIGGDLIVRSKVAPVIAEGAKITGQVLLQEPTGWWHVSRWEWWGLSAVIMAAGTVLTGIILMLFGRAAFGEALAHAAFRPLSSGLIGLATSSCCRSSRRCSWRR